MSSSGRISYSSSNFLRFWRPEYIQDAKMMESKDRLQGKLRTFSREMFKILEENKDPFKEAAMDLLNSKGFLYEEDLFKSVFNSRTNEFIEGRFAVHKFLFESSENWIKDGQWNLNCFDGSSSISAGPYIARPQWQMELLRETRKLLGNEREVENFKSAVLNCLQMKRPDPSISENLFVKCLKVFADEFYVNVQNHFIPNPFKEIVNTAFLGVAIVDSQLQARELLERICAGRLDNFDASRPFSNSFVSKSTTYNDVLILKEQPDSNSVLEICDFGSLPVYLIDPKGTLEVDDGVSVELVANSNEAILHVHVADPCDLVTGDLEREAQRRVGTLYLPEIKVPMLPERITLQSTLRDGGTGIGVGIKTLTFTCRIDLESGELRDHKIRHGIIKNLKHMTYEEADQLKENNPEIQLLKKITSAHLKQRESRGHLDFSFPRGLAQLDRSNKRILIKLDGDEVEMKKIVAEAMIIAGRIAGESLRDREIVAPFRTHSGLGIGIETGKSPNSLSLLKKYEMLKGMPAASVSITPRPHISMGLNAYVKVTSPLRRFLDLITHKIIKRPEGTFYDSSWFSKNLKNVQRQEDYNKKLGFAVNRFWVEQFMWQEIRESETTWTLIPLEKIKENLWTVHVEEVASNFIVQVRSVNVVELGESLKGRIVSRPHDSILKFELINKH